MNTSALGCLRAASSMLRARQARGRATCSVRTRLGRRTAPHWHGVRACGPCARCRGHQPGRRSTEARRVAPRAHPPTSRTWGWRPPCCRRTPCGSRWIQAARCRQWRAPCGLRARTGHAAVARGTSWDRSRAVRAARVPPRCLAPSTRAPTAHVVKVQHALDLRGRGGQAGRARGRGEGASQCRKLLHLALAAPIGQQQHAHAPAAP